MSILVPTKYHLREVLLFCFNQKKSAAESYRLLVETYGEHSPSQRTCERWYQRFQSGDLVLNDRERPGQPKKFEDEELKTLLHEDPNQTLKKLATSLNVTEMAISKRLKKQNKKRKRKSCS